MRNILKFLMLVAFSSALLSSACKEMAGHSTDDIIEVGEGFEVATIVYKKGVDGCQFLVTVGKGKDLQLYTPIEMDKQFKEDGLKVKIKFHTSRIQQEGCFDAQPIVIEEIEKI